MNLLLTGNELMTGDTVDSNSALIAERLAANGWRVHKKVTVGDELALLCDEIESLCRDCDVLIVNGGLGPTVDDLTAVAMARVGRLALREHPAARQHLENWCAARGFQLNAANLKQAILPEGCDIIANARGSAVGIQLNHAGCLILATPGVPSELRNMLDEEIIPQLAASFPTDNIHTVRLGVFGIGESGLQEMINRAMPDWPDDIELGFRASIPVLEVKLTTRDGISTEKLHTWRSKVESLLGDHLLGEMPIDLPTACLKALAARSWNLATAESCTGGLIAAEITRVPGASSCFKGGIVSYSNSMKQALLNVSEDSLQSCGAVSESVAREMASGALERCGADIAVAVTGIAGPDGGSEEKPVGTVWIAWGTRHAMNACQLQLPFDREMFQNMVAALSMDLVRRTVCGFSEFPQFLQRYRRS